MRSSSTTNLCRLMPVLDYHPFFVRNMTLTIMNEAQITSTPESRYRYTQTLQSRQIQSTSMLYFRGLKTRTRNTASAHSNILDNMYPFCFLPRVIYVI